MSKRVLPLMLLLLLFSCQESEKQKVERIATEYLNLAKNKEFDKMHSYCTKETQQNMDMSHNQIVFAKVTEVKNVSCVIDSNKAHCTFCCAGTPYDGELGLVKVDGKWLVHIPKETPPVSDSTSYEN